MSMAMGNRHLDQMQQRRLMPTKFVYGAGQYYGGAALFKDTLPRPGKTTEVYAQQVS